MMWTVGLEQIVLATNFVISADSIISKNAGVQYWIYKILLWKIDTDLVVEGFLVCHMAIEM